MPSKRDRLAALLDKVGVLDASLRTRRALGVPWLTVLSYHRIGTAGSIADDPFDRGVMDASEADFDAQMAYVARHFTVLGVDELCAALAGGPLPENPALVTFDDGYRACHDKALPTLARHGLRATFFIATRFVEERRLFWWDRLARAVQTTARTAIEVPLPEAMQLPTSTPAERAASLRKLQKIVKLKPGLDVDGFVHLVEAACGRELDRAEERRLADGMVMTWDQVRALAAAGQDIGSHTRSHRVLQTIGDAELDDELRGSRKELEAQLGRPVRALAYPVGYSVLGDKRIVNAVERAGYQVAFTNASGLNHTRRPHRLDVKRVATEYGMSMSLFRASVALPTVW